MSLNCVVTDTGLLELIQNSSYENIIYHVTCFRIMNQRANEKDNNTR